MHHQSPGSNRGGEAVAAQRAEEGQGPPPPLWRIAAQAPAALAPAPQRRHVGLDPGLVDEHQPARVEPGLEGSPAMAPAGDIGAGLLKREQRFF